MSSNSVSLEPLEPPAGSPNGVVSWGAGMHLIKIVGVLTSKELPAIFAMMDYCKVQTEAVSGRRNIGFYLDSDGGPHEVIKKLVAKIEEFRSKHQFHFYVEIRHAASSVVLIVMLADEDKRAIESNGTLIIHDGHVQLGLSDFTAEGIPHPGHFERLKEAVEFYKGRVWSPTGLDPSKLNEKQRAKYTGSGGILELSAEECINQFDFRRKS